MPRKRASLFLFVIIALGDDNRWNYDCGVVHIRMLFVLRKVWVSGVLAIARLD